MKGANTYDEGKTWLRVHFVLLKGPVAEVNDTVVEWVHVLPARAIHINFCTDAFATRGADTWIRWFTHLNYTA